MPARLPLALLVLALLPGRALALELVFAYPERPPYNYTVDGKARGFLVDVTSRIAAEAGIKAVFQEMPAARILEEVRDEKSTLCSIGWFKTPERETFALFTRPIFRDLPLVAVALQRRQHLFAGKTTLRALAEDHSLTLGLVQAWTYGASAGEIIGKAKPRVMLAPDQPRQARMLAAGRFDYTLARLGELPEIASQAGLPRSALLVIPLTDLSDQGVRHILCGRGVPREIMDRIDAAIPPLPSPESR